MAVYLHVDVDDAIGPVKHFLQRAALSKRFAQNLRRVDEPFVILFRDHVQYLAAVILFRQIGYFFCFRFAVRGGFRAGRFTCGCGVLCVIGAAAAGRKLC